jgi:D-glycerate 3-kinase
MSAKAHMTKAVGFPDALVQAALADALSRRRPDGPTVLLAVSGLQGSGKSTFAEQLAQAAQQAGHRAAVLSIDDVYLTGAERRRLAADVHPLLGTRGPPGSHDLALAAATLDAIAAGTPLRLPRFDKLADDRVPESDWPRLEAPLSLLVLEGWFLGTPAEDDAALQPPLNALERDEDGDGRWRDYCNRALRTDYPALWQRFDSLWLLRAPCFEVVPAWRWEQEQALRAARPGASGMDRAQLDRFIQHYERVSRQALRTLPALAQRVVALDEARRPRLA